MKTFFVPGISIKPDEESYEKALEYRNKSWESLVKIGFDLAYYAHIPYTDLENMSPIERDALYQSLIDQKQSENEEADKLTAKLMAHRRGGE